MNKFTFNNLNKGNADIFSPQQYFLNRKTIYNFYLDRGHIKVLLDTFYSLSADPIFSWDLNPNIPIGSKDIGPYEYNTIIFM